MTIFEIISIVIVLDSAIALVIAFTRVGDTTIEAWPPVKRYLPLTKGWALLYTLLALYIAYLTFFVLA
ncbi:MAG TPA: hypothetical protein VKP88_07725 [Candidatus Paceibacterota bacterium]|nr:hypothetical protein [Candidatus Paceibacterota bacterium]